jgi:hypothetical protein
LEVPEAKEERRRARKWECRRERERLRIESGNANAKDHVSVISKQEAGRAERLALFL